MQLGLRASSSHRPHHHFSWGSLANTTTAAESSLANKTYSILLLSALGLSVAILLLSWIISGDPVFGKEATQSPRTFRIHEYESLPTHIQNGNGIGHAKEKKGKSPEPLLGWRLRMGILHAAVVAGLVAIHVAILITDGVRTLRLMFFIYWVW